MTIAELSGKLSASGSNVHERLEDLLTSNVFGALRYLQDGSAVVQLVGDAVRQDGSCHTLREDIEEDLDWRTLVTGAQTRAIVSFWPRLGRSEPDVLYEWIGQSSRFCLLLEVKYLSGKSGVGLSEDDDGMPALSDQLARERLDLIDRLERADHGALVYLTVHPVVPDSDIRATLESIERMGVPGPPHIYWTNWQSIYRNLLALNDPAVRTTNEVRLLADMQRLLEHKGLTGLLPWDFSMAAPDFGPVPPWYSTARVPSLFEWPEVVGGQSVAWYAARNRLSHWLKEFGGPAIAWYGSG